MSWELMIQPILLGGKTLCPVFDLQELISHDFLDSNLRLKILSNFQIKNS